MDFDEDCIRLLETAEVEHEKRKKTRDDENALFTKRSKANLSLSMFRVKRGVVAVAKYVPGKPPVVMKDFVSVLIHTASTSSPLGAALSPYVLRNEQGCLLENIWQFSKFYPRVTAQNIPLGRFHPETVIWKHPAEVHRSDDGEPNEAYWKWRVKGMQNSHAVRYPNGFDGRHMCICTIWPDRERPERLSYIEARKRVYCEEYRRLAPRTASFKKLCSLLDEGKNLLLIEVDGPDPSLKFEPYNRLSRDLPGLMMDEQTTRMLLEDTRKPFGHGYTIAALLLGGGHWLE